LPGIAIFALARSDDMTPVFSYQKSERPMAKGIKLSRKQMKARKQKPARSLLWKLSLHLTFLAAFDETRPLGLRIVKRSLCRSPTSPRGLTSATGDPMSAR